MRITALAVGILSLMSAGPAGAAVIYDTLHVSGSPNSTQIINPGALPRGGPIGIEFNSGAATTIGQIQLQLNALNPNDGGSVFVYLVPNAAGAPANNGGSGSTYAFLPTSLLGTILDSALPMAPNSFDQGATINVPLAGPISITAGTEYWLGITATGSADLVFDLNPYTSGIGTSGQSNFFQAAVTCPGNGLVICGTPGVPTTYSLVAGKNVYEVLISDTAAVPEPATLAVLGAGLFSLGLARRRRRAG